MATLSTHDYSRWVTWVGDYDSVLAEFNRQYTLLNNNLQYIKQHHPELLGEWGSLVKRAQSYFKTLQSLRSTRDGVVQWLERVKSSIGSGYEYIKTNVENVASDVRKRMGLGAVPVAVIGIGVAAGTILVIAYWVKEAQKFNARIAALQAQEARGLTPEQASAIVTKTTGAPTTGALQSAIGNFDIPWTPILIVGGVVLLASFVVGGIGKK